MDGNTNLPNGGSVVAARALLGTTAPTGTTTWASAGHLEGGIGAVGRFYGPVYTSVTQLGANATASLHVSSTNPNDDWECGGFSPDVYIVRLFDHDPEGLPENGVQLGAAWVNSPGWLGGVISFSFGNAAYTIQPGHRLVVDVDLDSSSDSYCTGSGGVALNSAAAPSSITVSETTLCTPTSSLTIPSGQSKYGTPLDVTGMFSATNVTGPMYRFGRPHSDPFTTWDTSKWTKTDVGNDVTTAPTARFQRLTVQGKGAGIRGTSDQFTFLSQTATFAGDFTLDVRVPALGAGGDAALEQVGLMVRQDLTAGAVNVAMLLTNGSGARFQHRTTAAGDTAVTSLAGPAAPQWLRLARSGGTFTGYVSADGVSWTSVGSQAVALTGTFRIGLAASSYKAGSAIRTQFSRFLVSDPALSIQSSWQDPSVPQPSLTWPRGNYSLAVSGADAACGLPVWAMNAFWFSLTVTTVGDYLTAEAPAVPQACPSLGTTDPLIEADRFTLVTSAYTDTITALTVAVTGPAAIQKLYVTSDDGTIVYGELASPPASATVTLSTPIPVSTSVAQFRLKIRPATYAALTSGTETQVRARVTAITGSNDVLGSDASSALLVVDRKPPALPIWGTTTLGENSVSLTWSNPALDLDRLVLLRSAPNATIQNTSLSPGQAYVQGNTYGTDTAAYVGQAQTTTDVTEGGFPYYYRLFSGDACRNWSAGIPQGPLTPLTSPPATAVGALAATLGLCAEVNLVASFTNDGNRNNSVQFGRGTSASGPFQNVTCTPARAFRQWSCTDVSPASGGTWYYRAAFQDPDGFAPPGQTALTGPIVVARCPPGSGTLVLTALAPTPDASAGPGATAIPAARFQLTVANSTVDVQEIVLTNLAPNPVVPGDFSELKLFEDHAPLGTWDASDVLVGVGSWDAVRGRWVLSGFTVLAGTHDYLLAVSVKYGSDGSAARAFKPSFSTSDIDPGQYGHLLGSATAVGGTITIAGAPQVAPVGDPVAGTAKPTVIIVNPDHGTVSRSSGGKIRVQAQVWDPGGVGISSVMLSHDSGADGTFTIALAPNGRYVLRGGATMYEAEVQLGVGGHGLQVRATNANGQASNSAPVFVTVNAAGSGDGRLLVRDNSSQLCNDCHALPTHSSQTSRPAASASRYGAWGASCRDCHAPHGTRNVGLVRETIVPPSYAGYEPTKAVTFRDPTKGDSGAAPSVSHVTSDPALVAAGTVGPCQVCHTRTASPDGVARWRRSGNSDDHFTGSEATRCTGCHRHDTGFGAVESKAGRACDGCHGGKLAKMQQGASRSAHVLGPAGGGLSDTLTWGDPLASEATAPAARSCVGMCHADHVHNDPAAFPAEEHASNLHRDATSPATRALTRDSDPQSPTYGFATAASTGAGTTRRDHVAGQTQGCISCHQRPVDAARPAIAPAAYDASAHGTSTAGGAQWQYVLHDDSRGAPAGTVSRFERNCTKCHAARASEASTPSVAGNVQGPHWSENPSLLGGALNPAGAASTNACYACHGGGSVGADWSNGKNVAAATAHATQAGQSGHPSDSVGATQHDSAAEGAMSFGNAFPGTTRHAGCVDCHDPHRAKAGLHTTPGSAAGPALEGAMGAKLASNPAAWAAPTAANFSVVRVQAGVDLEATLCFRCHSSFAWGTGTPPTSPSLGAAYTDQAREFNPANAAWGSYHPVLATSATTNGRIDLRNLKPPWSTTVRNRMTCSDCHASMEPGASGPHGSAAKFILKGPSTRWDATVAVGQTDIFCFNCHYSDFRYSRASVHTDYDPSAYFSGHAFACFTCHAGVPHGSPRPGFLVDGVARTAPGYDDVPQYNRGSWLRVYGYPPPEGQWGYNNCACGSDQHGE